MAYCRIRRRNEAKTRKSLGMDFLGSFSSSTKGSDGGGGLGLRTVVTSLYDVIAQGVGWVILARGTAVRVCARNPPT